MNAKKLKLSVTACVAAVALMFGGATAASAIEHVKNPAEGGTWKHGSRPFGGTTWDNYSEYIHSSKYHLSRVKTKDRKMTNNSGATAKGKWAKASLVLAGGADSFYGVCASAAKCS